MRITTAAPYQILLPVSPAPPRWECAARGKAKDLPLRDHPPLPRLPQFPSQTAGGRRARAAAGDVPGNSGVRRRPRHAAARAREGSRRPRYLRGKGGGWGIPRNRPLNRHPPRRASASPPAPQPANRRAAHVTSVPFDDLIPGVG